MLLPKPTQKSLKINGTLHNVCAKNHAKMLAMKPKYTAKVIFEDGELLEKSGDNIEELMAWMYAQAEAGFSDINGEIIDNHHHRVIKSIQYSPPE